MALAGPLAACRDLSVTVSAPKVRVIEETRGIGPPVRDGQIATIKYRVTLPDGREIMRDEEHSFEVGRRRVIEGIDEAVRGMRLRGRRLISCPPNKHWGSAGHGGGAIPRDTHLIIEIELLRIE
jgi:FKBP-type peptidyl-prolyl cis-trans isomerase